ncbi:hypothetical protein [Brevundimonas sp.]|jgi:hypothetical protein|uniref:hypothetical protein n=1 Tax=Brevundimonas sp. TaxID=1871086 RepID=UPI002487621C|nr:hypothetical protein [Brevundimonas sp.]MDI1282256.1 hypothetical protein [Brevundimonas sp.]
MSTERRQRDMDVAASVMMMMADRRRTVRIRIDARVGHFVRSHMNVNRVMVVIHLAQGDGGPISGVAESML